MLPLWKLLSTQQDLPKNKDKLNEDDTKDEECPNDLEDSNDSDTTLTIIPTKSDKTLTIIPTKECKVRPIWELYMLLRFTLLSIIFDGNMCYSICIRKILPNICEVMLRQ